MKILVQFKYKIFIELIIEYSLLSNGILREIKIAYTTLINLQYSFFDAGKIVF